MHRYSTTFLIAAAAAALTAACAPLPAGTSPDTAARLQRPELPASAETARQRLERSPRHGEWAMVAMPGGDSLRVWLVYPERSTPAPVVLVVHEIYGLTHWIRAVADQLAAEGFIAVAPDLITAARVPTGPDGDPLRDEATAAVRALDPAVYQPRLRTVADWAMALPAARDRYGIIGFCWGGTAAFTHAAVSPDVAASVVYYGSSPATERLAAIRAPVLGLYAGDDERVNATVAPARQEMQRLGRTYDVHFFDGAGHGFLRQQDGRDGANLAATRGAWPRTGSFLREHLER